MPCMHLCMGQKGQLPFLAAAERTTPGLGMNLGIPFKETAGDGLWPVIPEYSEEHQQVLGGFRHIDQDPTPQLEWSTEFQIRPALLGLKGNPCKAKCCF